MQTAVQIKKKGDGHEKFEREGKVGLGLVRSIKRVRLGVLGLMVSELILLLRRQNRYLLARCEGRQASGLKRRLDVG